MIPRPAAGWNIERIATHPGALLREDFLPELALTASELAARIHLPLQRVRELLRERRAVTADTALRLARFFDTSPEFWLNLQAAHDLSKARIDLKATLEAEIQPLKPSFLTA